MAMPRKSEAMHKLTGTKSQAGPEPEFVAPPGRPKYPKGISGDARAAFKRLVQLLEKRRSLTDGDGELLRIYALVYDRHMRAMEKIQEQGEVVAYSRLNNHGEEVKTEKPNLWLAIAETCEKNLVSILDRLGLTPHNRSKIKPTAKPADPKPKNEFEEFLARGRGDNWVMPVATEQEGIADEA